EQDGAAITQNAPNVCGAHLGGLLVRLADCGLEDGLRGRRAAQHQNSHGRCKAGCSCLREWHHGLPPPMVHFACFVLDGSVRRRACLGKPGRYGAAHTYLLVNLIPALRPSSLQSSSVLRPAAWMPWAASSSSQSSVSPVTPTAPITSPASLRICRPPPSGKICSPLALFR